MKPWFPPEKATLTDVPAELQAPPMLDRQAASTRTCLFVATFVAAVAATLLPRLTGMRVNESSFLAPFTLVPSAAVLWTWATWRRRPRVRAATELALMPLLLSLPVLVFSYAAMHADLPLQDTRLEAWDAALGFNALEFVGWIDRHPGFARALACSYISFFPQMLMLPLVLVIANRLERAYAATFVVLLLGVMGSAVSVFFPAVGFYVHHGIRDGAFPHVAQSLGYFHVQLDAVRSDPNFVLDVAHAKGIVSFPSGHAAIAVLCAWAAWPLQRARWPFVALNVAMVVSTIPQGAHYLVDVIAGVLIAIASILIATRLPRAFAAGAA
jgi:membrane-associated phospholipid phosphatase